ncbi:MAG: S1 RNA-binding domain-containing protein [Zavarzinella sp.]
MMTDTPSNQPTPEPETTPTAPVAENAPVAAPETAAPESGVAPADPTAAPGGEGKPDDSRRKFYRDKRPKEPEKRKIDFTELSTGLKIRALDEQLEAEMAAAMSGFDSLMGGSAPSAAPAPQKQVEENQGRIIAIRGNDVFLDLPGKRMEGLMSLTMFAEKPQIGDVVDVHFESVDNENGLIRLSKKGAAISVDWSSVRVGQTVEARVTGTNRGGLAVEVNGIRGFMPISQIDIYRVENADSYINQRLVCEITEANPTEKNLVVSRRILLERERETQKAKFWEEMEEGQVRKGTVRSIQKFGAFVDLGGADGLIPMNELAWHRVDRAEDLLQIGQVIEVKVAKIDRATRKISLSLKALAVSPWETLGIHAGSRIQGKVTRIMEFGAFVEITPGVEGLVHVSELSVGKVYRVRDVVQEGQQVDVQVLNIDKENRKISLSIKALQDEQRRKDNEIAQAELAAKLAAEEAEEAANPPKPKKPIKFKLRGGK